MDSAAESYGYHVDVGNKLIRLADANIEGGIITLQRHWFNPGNAIMLLRSLQELRGMFPYRTNCNPWWATSAQPVDAGLVYPDELSLWVRCGDFGITDCVLGHDYLYGEISG